MDTDFVFGGEDGVFAAIDAVVHLLLSELGVDFGFGTWLVMEESGRWFSVSWGGGKEKEKEEMESGRTAGVVEGSRTLLSDTSESSWGSGRAVGKIESRECYNRERR